MELVPFRVLLYRYFFYAWLFRDANQRDRFARAAAWRYNKAQARWLPKYMKRYVVCGMLLFVMGLACEQGSPALSAIFYVPSVLTFPATAVTAVAWVGFQVGD